ncbi:hypothetical protein ACFVQ9_35460 [Streptomyces goshikiensis]|uniref:hypothetical protein n=1 Tax=Streptomyces goshikiensis TaxID=1942 RepID=UPI003696E327
MPEHVSGVVLRTEHNGCVFERVVMWADRPTAECPNCHQPVSVTPDCPVALDGLEWHDLDQQHGCGRWLEVDSVVLPVEGSSPSAARMTAAGAELLAAWHERQTKAVLAVEHRLRSDLRTALDGLRTPLGDGESREEREEQATTGDEVTPGVYRELDGWVAWDHDPRGGDDPLLVREAEL